MRAPFLIFVFLLCGAFSAFSSDALRIATYNLCNLAVYEAKYGGKEDYIPFAFHCLLKRGLAKDARALLDSAAGKEVRDLITYMMMQKEVSFEVEKPGKSLKLKSFLWLSPSELEKRLRDEPLHVKKSVLSYLAGYYFYTQKYSRFWELVRHFKPFISRKRLLKFEALFYYRTGDYRRSFSVLKRLNDNFSYYWRYRLSRVLGISPEVYEEKLYESKKFDFYKILFLWEKGVYRRGDLGVNGEPSSYLCRLVKYAQSLGMDGVSLDVLKECRLRDSYWFGVIPELDNPSYAIRLLYADRVLAFDSKLPFLYPEVYSGTVKAASWAYGVDDELVYAVMRQESLFDRFSVSRSNAFGLMQILPSTGRWLAEDKMGELFFKNKLFYPFYSIKYGVWYLSYLKKTLPDFLAVAAYNSGPNAVRRWLNANKWVSHISEFVEFYPRAETRTYVKRVFSNLYFYRLLSANPSGN